MNVISNLPEWHDCERKIKTDNNNATPLERFIYEHEPAGLEECQRFRKMLAEAIHAAQSGGEVKS